MGTQHVWKSCSFIIYVPGLGLKYLTSGFENCNNCFPLTVRCAAEKFSLFQESCCLQVRIGVFELKTFSFFNDWHLKKFLLSSVEVKHSLSFKPVLRCFVKLGCNTESRSYIGRETPKASFLWPAEHILPFSRCNFLPNASDSGLIFYSNSSYISILTKLKPKPTNPEAVLFSQVCVCDFLCVWSCLENHLS